MKKRTSKAPSTRRRFASLRVSQGFREFVLDQLSGVADLQAKAMFGGVGLYAGDVFFGIVAADVLYLKVGDANRAAYTRAGSTPFAPYPDRPASKSYYSVPAQVLEDSRALMRWAKQAIEVAHRRKF
jgi:DNA transformation protein and related proteins